MSHPNSSASASFWLYRAHVLAMRLNFHHWLARLIPKLFGVLVLTALFELFRREIGCRDGGAGPCYCLARVSSRAGPCSKREGIFAARIKLWRGWRRCSGCTTGLARRATGSSHGRSRRSRWTTATLRIGTRSRCRLWREACFWWSAHLVPVSRLKLGADSAPISEPPELAQVQNWINALKADDLIEPEKTPGNAEHAGRIT